MFALIVRGLLI